MSIIFCIFVQVQRYNGVGPRDIKVFGGWSIYKRGRVPLAK